MNTRRVVAALSLALALAISSPAKADWENPDDCPPQGLAFGEELILAAQFGFQIAQVAL
jgi:hypothetical protein